MRLGGDGVGGRSQLMDAVAGLLQRNGCKEKSSGDGAYYVHC